MIQVPVQRIAKLAEARLYRFHRLEGVAQAVVHVRFVIPPRQVLEQRPRKRLPVLRLF